MSSVGKFAIHLKPDGKYQLLKLTVRMEAETGTDVFSPRRIERGELSQQVRSNGVLIVVDSGRLIPVLEAITASQLGQLPLVLDEDCRRLEAKIKECGGVDKWEKQPREKRRKKDGTSRRQGTIFQEPSSERSDGESVVDGV